MKIHLDIALAERLRKKINSSNSFVQTKRGFFRVPTGKRGKPKELEAYNCICAVMDRIESLVRHCNSLDITQSEEGVFALCDLLNYGQTLIDCIETLGRIYQVENDDRNSCEIFEEPGQDQKGSDEKYFKYLRSLCAIHPVETTAHKEYQGDEPEWCPYIRSSGAMDRLLPNRFPNGELPEFCAVVYRNDQEWNKDIPIYVEQLFRYIAKRYQRLEKIIGGIERYNQDRISDFQNKQIPSPDDFEKYEDYLRCLYCEMEARYGSAQEIKEWAAIFRTHFEDDGMEKLLQKYQAAMKLQIVRIHNDLQKMECLKNEWNVELFRRQREPELDEYGYECEKLIYLYPDIENDEWKFDFIDEPLLIDKYRMDEMINMVEQSKKEGYSHEELRCLGRYIDSKYHVSDSEWARIQLKIMEDKFSAGFPFDYFQNNWHLWVQSELARWENASI